MSKKMSKKIVKMNIFDICQITIEKAPENENKMQEEKVYTININDFPEDLNIRENIKERYREVTDKSGSAWLKETKQIYRKKMTNEIEKIVNDNIDQLQTEFKDLSMKESETEYKNIKYVSEYPDVKETDIQDNLTLYCYTTCSDESDEKLKEIRGLIFQDDKLVVKTFNYTPEIVIDETEKVNQYLGDDYSKTIIFNSEEGSILRLYYVNDRWYLSTNKKIDAHNSRWGKADSFGNLFRTALLEKAENDENFSKRIGYKNNQKEFGIEINPELKDFDENLNKNIIFTNFCDTLDKNKIYTFLLTSNNKNRIVCQNEKTKLYHVGTFDSNFDLSITEDIGIPYPTRLNILNLKELQEHINTIDIYKSQGVVVYLPGNKQVKIYNREYFDNMKLRGNNPCIVHRYLYIRSNPDQKEKYFNLYPEYITKFELTEKYIDKIANDILNAYIDRFLKKKYVEVIPEKYAVVRACLFWHFENKEQNKIHFAKVKELLLKQHPVALYKILQIEYYKDLF